MDINNGVVYLNEDEKRVLVGKDLPEPLTPADVQENIPDWLASAGERLDDLWGRYALDALDQNPNISRDIARAEEVRDILIGMAGTLLTFEVEQSL